MIVLSQHDHDEIQLDQREERKRKIVFNAENQTRRMFEEMLGRSGKRLHYTVLQILQKTRQKCQNKVYLVLEEEHSDYLSILVKQKKSKIQDLVPLLDRVIEKTQKKVFKDLKNDRLELNQHPQKKSIKQIKRQLHLQINSIKNIYSFQAAETEQQKATRLENYNNMKQYKYTISQNPSNSINKSIIQSSRERRKRFQKYSKEAQLKERSREIRQQRQEEQRIKKVKQELHQHNAKIRKDKQLKAVEQNQKKQQIERFLMKYKQKGSAHIILAQNFKKKEQKQQIKAQQLLQQLSIKKRHSSLLQIRQRAKQLQEMKEKHNRQKQEQMQFQNQEESQIKYKLNHLYKSQKYDRKIKAELSRSMSQSQQKQQLLKQNKEKLLKMILFDNKIKKQYFPKVDMQKRQQLMKSVQKLKKYQDKNTVKKVKNGEIITINKDQLNYRLFGIKYFEQLKEMLSSMPRKQKQPEKQPQIKLVDRSKITNHSYIKRQTLSNWKSIMQNDKIDLEKKQLELKNYFQILEAEQKSANRLKVKSSLSKSIDLQRKVDQYEIEKTEAKLALLKNYQ